MKKWLKQATPCHFLESINSWGYPPAGGQVKRKWNLIFLQYRKYMFDFCKKVNILSKYQMIHLSNKFYNMGKRIQFTMNEALYERIKSAGEKHFLNEKDMILHMIRTYFWIENRKHWINTDKQYEDAIWILHNTIDRMKRESIYVWEEWKKIFNNLISKQYV